MRRVAPLQCELEALAWWNAQRAGDAAVANAPRRELAEGTVGPAAPTPPLLASQVPQSDGDNTSPNRSNEGKTAPPLPKLNSIAFVQRSGAAAQGVAAQPYPHQAAEREMFHHSQGAVVCDDARCAETPTCITCDLPNCPSTDIHPVIRVQAHDSLGFPEPSASQQSEILYPKIASSGLGAAVEVIDDHGIDERIKSLSIDIRPRRLLAAMGTDEAVSGSGALFTEADLTGDSRAALDTTRNYLPSAYPASPIRTVNYREFVWAAPSFYHRPLYFEQKNLERYGYHYGGVCMQSAVSAAHFFATIPVLPYKMTLHRPHECDYTLGHYRPGNCAPNRLTRCEFDLNALAVEGVVATGCAIILY